MGFGIPELLIILLIVGLLFGTKKLRNMGGDLGSAIKSFKSAVKEPEDKEQLNNTAEQSSQDNVIEGEIETKSEEDSKS